MENISIQRKIADAAKRAQEKRDYNAFALELYDQALNYSKAADHTKPLSDLIFSVKDLFQLNGTPLKAGTKVKLPEVGPQGPVLNTLLDAGAICIGKTNTHEIALGLTGENQWTGDVKNPLDPLRQSGGSSSGAAVSVALDLCDFAIGTDTGGSMRVPASHSGIIGFKPTFDALSTEGVLPLCKSCDHVGIFAKELSIIKRVAAVLDINFKTEKKRDKRIGIPWSYLKGKLSKSVRAQFEKFVNDRFPNAKNVELPSSDEVLDIYKKLRVESAFVHRKALKDEPENFSPLVRDTLLAALPITGLEYLAAKESQKQLTRAIDTIFQDCDFILLPTSPAPAPLRGQTEIELESGVQSARQVILSMNLPFSLSGVPVLSLPMLTIDNLPVGIQIIAPRGDESNLFEFADELIGRKTV